MNDALGTDDNPIAAAAACIEFVPTSIVERVSVVGLFGREAPLEVDIGCGEGAFLTALASRHPERNYLGIERLLGRVRSVCRSVAARGMTNVRLLRMENAYAITHLLPLGSVCVAHVLFPDPWPKRYHHPRRLIQDSFLASMHAVLRPAGEFCVKTDDLPYFQWMEKVFTAGSHLFERIDWPEEPDHLLTNFERHFLSKGLPIYRARLRKL